MKSDLLVTAEALTRTGEMLIQEGGSTNLFNGELPSFTSEGDFHSVWIALGSDDFISTRFITQTEFNLTFK